MTLMLSDFGIHEVGCCCAPGSEPHTEECKDCDCGLTAAISFGVEQSGLPLEPPPATPEEEARLHEIGTRIVEGLLTGLPLIEDHAFDDGDRGSDYCWAHVSAFGHGSCGLPKKRHMR
jgi:hypothetical protein